MKKLIIASILPVALFFPLITNANLPKAASNAVEHTLTDVYSNNNKNGCLLFTHHGDYGSADYCVKVEKSDLKTINGVRNLFILVSGDLYDNMAAHGQSGIGGLFLFVENSKKWELVSSNPYIKNGGWGHSQLLDFNLEKIGPSKYGWLGGYGYAQGGCGGEKYTLYSPIGPEVKEVYSFYTDEVCDWDDLNYDDLATPKVVKSKPINGYYPIYQAGNNPKKNTIRLVYSPAKQKYVQR